MLRVLAIGFPAIVMLAAFALLRPRRIPDRPSGVPTHAPVPLAWHLAKEGTYVFLVLALTPLIAAAHHALLVAAGEASGGGYSHRLSDDWSIAFLVALFVAMLVSFWLTLRLLEARFGDRYALLLDEPGLQRGAPSLRRQIVGAPRVAAVVGLLSVVFVSATFDNALVVRDGRWRYRPLFGAATEHGVEEVACLYVRPNRGRRFLKLALDLRDGTEVFLWSELDRREIAQAIAAFQAQAPRRIPVVGEGQ
jgi:hypothetical protein